MKTVEDQNFTKQDLSGMNFRFHTFMHCNFTDANLTGADLTGATFHGCTLSRTTLTRAKATAVRWCKGGGSMSDCVVDVVSDFDAPLSADELAYAAKNSLLQPGSSILTPQDFSSEYVLPCEEHYSTVSIPEDYLRNKPPDYVRKKMEFCFKRIRSAFDALPQPDGTMDEFELLHIQNSQLFELMNVVSPLCDIDEYLRPKLESSDRENFMNERHSLVAALIKLFKERCDSFRTRSRIMSEQERVDFEAQRALDVEYIGVNATRLIEKYFRQD